LDIILKPIGASHATEGMSVVSLVDTLFSAFNAARLREGANLWSRVMSRPDVTVGVALSGALTPAGLGASCLVPLIKRGFIDYITSTGANLYHDIHFALGLNLFQSHPGIDDRILLQQGLVRIYDILVKNDVLSDTDAFIKELCLKPELSKCLGSAEIHYLVGKYLYNKQKELHLGDVSILAAAYEMEVPIYAPSPGDSAIGMEIAAAALDGTSSLSWDINRDVNELAGLVLLSRQNGGKTGVVIFGGGAPKNYILQTECYLQYTLGTDKTGHDHFLQITDARPDTGGLSGATPSEAVSWCKLNVNELPNAVVCYTDSTIALPLLTAYLIETRGSREPKRLYRRRDEAVSVIKKMRKRSV
jgi:deoxyhypusine synthase